jgi:hypothetical protein
MVPEGPSCGIKAELSTIIGVVVLDCEGSEFIAGVKAALVWTLPEEAVPVSAPETLETIPPAPVCAWTVCVPVMAAKKSPKTLARAIVGKSVVTTKSIEIKETTAVAMPDFRYFLPFGCESAGDCCFLGKISLNTGFYDVARQKEG